MASTLSTLSLEMDKTSTFSSSWLDETTEYAVSSASSLVILPSSSTPVPLTEELLTHALWLYVSPVILILGICNNILTLCVVTRRRMRYKSASSLYLGCLAVTDATVLLSGLGRFWILELTNQQVDIRKLSLVSCKLHTFSVYWFSYLGSWILVVMTTERVISVYLPIKAKRWCTLKRARYNLALVACLLTAMTAHIFWTSGDVRVVNPEGQVVLKRCTYVEGHGYAYFLFNIWPWMDLTLLSFLPAVIIITGNIMIVCKLTSSKFNRRSQVVPTGVPSTQTKLTSMTTILISVSVTFILTTTPLTTFLIVDADYSLDDRKSRATHDLIYACLTLLYYVNPMCNFWLYCLSGPRFRKELMAMIKCKSNQGALNSKQSVFSVTRPKSNHKVGHQNTPQ